MIKTKNVKKNFLRKYRTYYAFLNEFVDRDGDRSILFNSLKCLLFVPKCICLKRCYSLHIYTNYHVNNLITFLLFSENAQTHRFLITITFTNCYDGYFRNIQYTKYWENNLITICIILFKNSNYCAHNLITIFVIL